MAHRILRGFIAFVVLALAIVPMLASQEFRGTITGRITDPQKAAIPNAKIVATLVSTGAKSETQSGADGAFTIPFLAPGVYRLEAESTGFKRYVRNGMEVQAGERIGLDIALSVGALTESVNVTAEAPLLETATATSGQVIDSQQVENLPMNGRTPLVLAQLSFGVVPNSDPKFNRPFDNAGPSGFSMGGAPAQNNELLIDGSPGTTGNLRVGYNPPVDAVEEVRVHVFEADAAYGHTGGGSANVILKSGSNTFHGSASEFNQNSGTSAAQFFTNAAGQRTPAFRYNQWGVTAGGPWYIPKVVNGRNKAFWFFGWEDINDSFPEPSVFAVPTAAERNGDFSALLAINKSYQIYDPSTGVLSGGRVTRQPFANNIIPAARLSAIAKNYLQFWPAANVPGNPDGTNNYISANQIRADTYNGELGRLDFNLSDRHKIFWSFRHNDRIEDRNNTLKNQASGRDLLRINWGTSVDDVFSLTPTTVMNIKLNWSRFREATVSVSDGFDATKLGFPSYLVSNSSLVSMPRLSFNSSAVGNCTCIQPLVTDTDGNTPFDIFSIFGDVVKVKGNHSLKAGADIREQRESNASYGNSSGNFSFNSNWTRGPLDNSTTAPFGQDFAAFMLGLPTGGGFDLNAFRTNQSKYLALFIQDDWRMRPNLTINMGLRYEHEFPTYERFNRSDNGFDISAVSPIAAAAIAAYAKSPVAQVPVGQFQVPGGLTFASASNSAIYHTESHIFSPRFGFAWTPGSTAGKTVIRGGASIFVFPIAGSGSNGAGASSAVNQPGFSQTTSVVASLDGMVTPYATLANPFPTGIQQPTGSSLGLSTFLGQSVTFFNPHVRNAYSVRWDLSLQRELPHKMVLELAYIGNHAVHLAEGSTAKGSSNLNLNYIPGKYLSTSPYRDASMIATNNLLSGAVANPFANLIPGQSLNGSTVSLQTLLLPYPEFGTVAMQNANGASSYFHSLDVRLQKKYSHGLTLLTNFTYSKLIEKIRLLNDFDLAPEKRVGSDDRPLRFIAQVSYELPIGKGKMLDFNRTWANRLLGGWSLNGIYTNQIGAPMGWGNIVYLGGPLNLNPHQVNGPAFSTAPFYFHDAAVQTNGADDPAKQRSDTRISLVSNVRTFPTQFSSLRSDGANNIDLSLIKETFLTEHIKFQFRFEAFNAFNRPEFSGPNLSPTSSAFGTITGQNNISRSVQWGARLTW